MNSNGFTNGPPPGDDDNDSDNDHNITQDSTHPVSGNVLHRDLSPTDHTNNPSLVGPHQYSIEQQACLLSISQEASDLFPPGKVYPNIKQLRGEVAKFGIRKGFLVTTVGSKLCCNRCPEPQYMKNRRDKRNASGHVAIENRRVYRSSTRCGCPFAISFAPVKRKGQTLPSVRITNSCIYQHDNGCFPSRDQLMIEQRKSGAYTRALNETKMKTILTVLNTNQKVPLSLMRELVRPLFPSGHSLNAQFLLNFRRKAERMLATKGRGDVDEMTFTNNDQTILLGCSNDNDMEVEFPTNDDTNTNPDENEQDEEHDDELEEIPTTEDFPSALSDHYDCHPQIPSPSFTPGTTVAPITTPTTTIPVTPNMPLQQLARSTSPVIVALDLPNDQVRSLVQRLMDEMDHQRQQMKDQQQLLQDLQDQLTQQGQQIKAHMEAQRRQIENLTQLLLQQQQRSPQTTPLSNISQPVSSP
jgi:hypothetical protein